MSIQSEINRIAGAKSDIADAIEDMGGTLSPGASIDDMAAGVRSIPQGTSDYTDLTNKPQINSVTLTGNKSLSDIGAYAKPAGGIPDTDIASASTWNAKGTYSKPSGGIPDTDIASASTWNAKGTYSKPSGGIPKTDLASAVQTSLGKADTALQSAPVTSVNSKTGAVSLSASDVGAGTYSKPSGGIPDSDIASASTWNAKAGASSALSLTLASGSWSSATPPTQTVSATGVTASNIIIVGFGSGITSAQYDAASAAKLACTAQAAGTITMTAFGTKPTANIPISVVILG